MALASASDPDKVAKRSTLDLGALVKTMSAKDAKNNFGRLIDVSRAEPVTIEKHGRPVVVVLAIETFELLSRGRPSDLPKIVDESEEPQNDR